MNRLSGLLAIFFTLFSVAQEQQKQRSEYSKSTYFEPGEAVIFPHMEVDYAIDEKNLNQLRLGNININQSTFFVDVRPLHALDATFRNQLAQKNEMTFVIHWPELLFPNPRLEIISGAGKPLWEKMLTPDDLKAWREKTTEWKKRLGGRVTNGAVLNSEFGIIGGDEVKRLASLMAGSFKICVSSGEGKGSSQYCSPIMAIKGGKKLYSQSGLKQRVLLSNEEAKLSGTIKADPNMPTSFFAEFGLGGSYGFTSEVSKPNLVDVVEVNDKAIKVVGFGIKPNGPVKIINQEEYGKLTRFFGFESTIKDDREFWEILISKTEPYLFFSGAAGGLFRQSINVNEVPKAKARIYIHKDTPTSVYLSEVKVKALKNPDANVTSDQNSIEAIQNNNREFFWNFKAATKGEINKSYLTVTQDGKTYTSFFEVYRSYANELSGRFTGIVSNSGQIVLGEVSYNRWFEKLLGQNSFSFQRWGTSVRYFKSLSPLSVSETEKESLTSLNADLKYRFTPGVWTRDETQGILLSYQDLTFGDFKSSMLGGGWFWARSMPRVFDNIFNWVPFMRYPKWVDMEFIYYFSSLKSNVTLNAPFTVNFHGQILWSKSFFGEAGFGLKRYAFVDKNLNQKAELNTFYGTLGLGIKF